MSKEELKAQEEINELQEVQTISQLMLMSRIRERSSKEFLHIIDQVVQAEFEQVNDTILMDVETRELIKMQVLAHYQETLD